MKSIMLRSVVSPRHLNLVLRPTLCSSGNVSTALTQFTAPVAASAPSYGFSVRGMSSPTASSAVVEDAAAKKPGGVNMGGKNSAGSGEEAGRTAGILLFCSLVGVTAGLGAWQAMRYSWKADLVAARKRKMAQEPVDLPRGSEGFAIARAMDELDQAAKDFAVVGAAGSKDGDSPGASGGMSLLAELEGRRIRVTGEFDHSREVLVGPRGAPPGLQSTSGGSSMAPSPMGDFVYTPLKFYSAVGRMQLLQQIYFHPSRAVVIYPTLGWSRPEGKVTVVGVLKAAEKRGTFSPVNSPETGRLLWLEKASLVKAAGLGGEEGGVDTTSSPPVLMEAVGPDDEDPRAQTPMVKRQHHFGEFYVMPVTHLMYAATWFSLAAAASVLTWIRFRRRPPVVATKPRGSA